jgi:hypothetical protein
MRRKGMGGHEPLARTAHSLFQGNVPIVNKACADMAAVAYSLITEAS